MFCLLCGAGLVTTDRATTGIETSTANTGTTSTDRANTGTTSTDRANTGTTSPDRATTGTTSNYKHIKFHHRTRCKYDGKQKIKIWEGFTNKHYIEEKNDDPIQDTIEEEEKQHHDTTNTMDQDESSDQCLLFKRTFFNMKNLIFQFHVQFPSDYPILIRQKIYKKIRQNNL